MKRISFPAIAIGVGMLSLTLIQASMGHPPYAWGEAFFLAALIVMLSAVGGFEWGFACLAVQVAVTGLFRQAWESAFWLGLIACLWYTGAILIAARGSRALMGIAAGVLFAGLLLERMATFTPRDWLLFFALLLLEISGMYLAGNALKGRWFSPYA